MRTYTQLVGTTGATSSILYPTSFTTLAKNNSAQTVAIAGGLVSDQHRYLLQRYFDNEKTVTLSTIGGQSLTTTLALSVGALSATLSAVWNYPTYSQLVTFSSGEQRTALFTYNSASIIWTVPLTKVATTAIKSVGVQNYNIPANISKIKNDTITIGQIQYQPKFVQTRQEWDMINTLPYTSDIPNYCFIYNGKLGFFPIPSTTGNVITFNYKSRVADFSFADYSTGTLANGGMVVGSNSVIGDSTFWLTTDLYPSNTDISFYNLAIKANTPYGDGIWYPISSFQSNIALTLSLPIVSAPNITVATTYTIGQLPLLSEDFHDMIVFGALIVYFTTIVPDSVRADAFTALYDSRLELLKNYAGTKSVSVDLESEPQQVNPNLFIYGN